MTKDCAGFSGKIALGCLCLIFAPAAVSHARITPKMTDSQNKAISIYVSPNGSDHNPGTLAEPLESLSAAQAAIRRCVSHGPKKVILRGGVYHLSKPLVLTAKDSGSKSGPVSFAAYTGERPEISGSVRLNLDWTSYRNGIFKANLPATIDASLIDQLFVDGYLQYMARYPNFDPNARNFGGTRADAFSKERVKTWSNPAGGYVHAMQKYEWGSLDYRILGSDAEGSLTLDGGWQINRESPMHDTERFVENIFEELDAPGEWFINQKTHVLYYFPVPGVNLKKAVVEASVSTSLVEFHGTASDPVRHISLSGLHFTRTSRTFMLTKEPLVRSDWCIYRGGAAFVTGTADCAIENCDFTNIGGNAVFVNDYNRNFVVKGCLIKNIGASGICFVGDPLAARAPLFNYDRSQPNTAVDVTPGPKSDNYPLDCYAVDNLIAHTGSIEKQSAGVEIDLASHITVSHCSIYDVPRSGVNIGDGCWGGHTIEYCDVFDTVKETGDHGSFNSWGRDRYWSPDRDYMNTTVASHPEWFKLDAVDPIKLINNRWVCKHGWDIDLDDGSSNYVIKNNLCLGGGIKNREGGHRLVQNNIIVNNSFHAHVWFEHSQDEFTHNIVGQDYHPIGMPTAWGTTVDYNLLPDSQALAHEQSAERDLHSASGNPAYVSPETGNYNVQPDSPALRLGFNNFPMDQFGVVSPRLRRQAQNGQAFASGKSQADAATRDPATHLWLGMTLKNVTELGERSATGIPDILGVLVLEVPASSPGSKLGFKKLDVIWSSGPTQIKDIQALQMRLSSKHDGPVGLSVYRNQKLIPLTVPNAERIN